jgi:hypothetical protein
MTMEKTRVGEISHSRCVGSLLPATAAFAEPPTVSQSQLQGSTWRASKVVGLNVYND